ncbi:uncharacterized protein LOC130676956 [Microplitis mediator]|uniref:uncharacterized protein LOC130676956 n=1 Tax=Microplitis mediator TaxID=375433 RepID=UPI002552AB92|nr:uncharacterized protein LOC130676956 [Microplitis mediator]
MMKKSLIFMTFHLMGCINCCVIETDRPLTEEVKKNFKSPWLVLIVDETITSPFGISYGAIIKENIVLTSAEAIFDHDSNNLLAVTDCAIGDWNEDLSPELCVSRRTEEIFPNYDSKKNIENTDWVMLILEEPFELTNEINTIPIINDDNIDDIDKDNCVVYQWMLEYDDFFGGISYGAIIKDNIVFTSSKAVLDRDVDNLLAVTDCEIIDWREDSSPKFCVSRRTAGIYPNDASKENIIDSDWVMLILEEPFEMTDSINTIPMINDDNFNDIDENDCLVYR